MCLCGNKKCKGLCSVSVGWRLYSLFSKLSELNLLKSVSIGKPEPDRPGSRSYIYPIGYQYFDKKACKLNNDFSRILSYKGVNIAIEKKLLTSDNGVRNCAEAFIKAIRTLDNPDIIEIKEAMGDYSLDKFNSDVLNFLKGIIIIKPVVADDEYNVAVIEPGKPEKYERLQLAYVQYLVNRETYKADWSFCFRRKTDGDRICKSVPVESYGSDCYAMKDVYFGRAVKEGVISYSRFGYIKPIMVKHNRKTLVIDDISIYVNDTVVGYWDESEKIQVDGKSLDPEIRAWLEQNRAYIAKYRKFMMPYLLGEPKVIELTDN